MSDFVAGFAARHAGVAEALQAAFAPAEGGFTPADLKARAGIGSASGPVSFSPQGDGPKHFHPANPGSNPTEGWDPLTAAGDPADPFAAAHAAGFAEGQAAARADSGDGEARDRQLLVDLAEALKADGRFDRASLARQLRQTVLFLVTKLIGEVGIAPDLLAQRIAIATDLLADAAESAMLRVNPADIAVLDGKLPGTIFAVGDEQVARGGFVLESASTIVEDGPDLWLEQLAQAIDRVALPKG
ncbi:MAG: FliH/SctL family protein [Pseudomonadota bacterium]|nr:FliH/SctL family protein [Pseudomonadota bacterium]